MRTTSSLFDDRENWSRNMRNVMTVGILIMLVSVIPFSLNSTVVHAKTWNLVSHTMAKSIGIEQKPIGMTMSFSTNEERAVSLFEIEFLDIGPAITTGRVTFSWKWYEPSGGLYRQQTKSETVSLRQPTRIWDEIKIAGSAAESKIGEWRVRVYVDEDQLYEEIFRIEQAVTFPVKVMVYGLEAGYRAGIRVDGAIIDHLGDGVQKRVELLAGVSHNISVDTVVPGKTGERYICAPSSIVVNVAVDVSFIYEKEYYLTVSSAYGSPRGEGWYRKESEATFSVTSPSSGGVGINYLFQCWTGDISSSSSSAKVVMDRPKTVSATWSAEYTQLYLILLIALLFGFGMVFLPVMKRWHARRMLAKKAEPQNKCPICGKPATYIPKGSRYYCSYCRRYT